jgi:hypothetical protein
MKATLPLIAWCWHAVFFGRGFLYRQWSEVGEDCVEGGSSGVYDGPECFPCDPDMIILPADEAKSIHKCSWVIHRRFPRPDQLLEDETAGRAFGVSDEFEEILNRSKDSRAGGVYDGQVGPTQQTRDRAAGVSPSGQGDVEALEVWDWYGRWRLPRAADATLMDFENRDMRETDLIVTYIPSMSRIIGVRKLRDLYPGAQRPRPFSEMSMSVDGSAWPKGLGEMLWNLQNSIDANEQLIDEITRLTAMPPVFYNPASGWDPDTTPLSPGGTYQTTDPAGVNQLKITANVAPLMARSQAILGYVQRLSRVTDPNMGLGSPNVQTAAGQLAMIEQSNVGVAMDTTFLREHLATFIQDIWELDCAFSDESTFFRVTEEDAEGLFDTKDGGAQITREERHGRFDFTLKFATSQFSKQQNEAKAVQEYTLLIANPLVAQNPKALWVAANKLLRALGRGDFSEYVPMPADSDLPVMPAEEWTHILQGEDVQVHPGDNDQLHIVSHMKMVAMENQAKNPDVEAIHKMLAHVVEHQVQKRDKAMQQATIQALTAPGGALETLMGGGAASGQPGQAPGMPMQPQADPSLVDPAAALPNPGHPDQGVM